MLFAYMTSDETNQDNALQMADDCDIVLCSLPPEKVVGNSDWDAVVYDWDYLPRRRQEELLRELLSGRHDAPVAVHGYNIDDEHVAGLRRRHVAVFRTFQPEILWLLQLLAARATSEAPLLQDEAKATHRNRASSVSRTST